MPVPNSGVSSTIADELTAAAAQCPDEAAVYCGSEQRTFAVVGVPDERLGEVTAAFVVPSTPVPAPDELIRWCRERLAGFKVPRRVWVVDSLPRVTVGKVAKPELRDRAIALLTSAVAGG